MDSTIAGLVNARCYTTRASYEKHEFLTLRERLGSPPNVMGSALLIILVFFVFLFIYLCVRESLLPLSMISIFDFEIVPTE